jgi:ABC-type multidrug transport system fused ATPase/permease subunit
MGAPSEAQPIPFNIFSIFRRVWRLMTPQEHRRSMLVFVGIFVNSFLEILGLAAVVPVIGLVIQPALIRENEYLSAAFAFTSRLGIDTEREFLMFASVGLVAAFLFKAIFNLGLNLVQTRFSLGIGHRISGLMWQYHFSQSLEDMRSTQSGQILVEIDSWPITLANSFIVGALRFLNELVVIVVIAIGLFVYEPIVLIFVSVLLGLGAILIRRFTKHRLHAYSEFQRVLGPQTATLINNAVRGFLEVMSFKASDAIRAGYLKKTQLLFRLSSNSQIMNMAPAKLYEVLAVTAVSASIFISLLLGNTNEEFLNLLVLMALSAYRIMPSMSRLNSQIMAMRQFHHVLCVIEAALISWEKGRQSEQEETPRQWATAHIELEGISVGYSTLPEPVLADLSCRFDAGKVHAIVGPSGSGKSTLVNAILGLHPFDAGTMHVGEDAQHMATFGKDLSLKSWLSHVGYLSQHPFLFNGNVRDNLTMNIPGATIDEDVVKQLIERLDLKECLGEDPLNFELLEGGNNLSGGQQQRLAILRALRIERPVLILDEATSALDGKKRDAVFGLLLERARKGTNVLLITHDMELAKQCDTVLDLGEGRNVKPLQRLNNTFLAQ